MNNDMTLFFLTGFIPCVFVYVYVCLTGERTGILVSAEDDILDAEEDDDDLDASVETDEGIVTDDTPAASEGEAVTDTEKVSSSCMCHTLHSAKQLCICTSSVVC